MALRGETQSEGDVPCSQCVETRREVAELRQQLNAIHRRTTVIETTAGFLEKAINKEISDRASSVAGIGARVGENENSISSLREKTAEDRGLQDTRARQMASRAGLAGGGALVAWLINVVSKIFKGG